MKTGFFGLLLSVALLVPNVQGQTFDVATSFSNSDGFLRAATADVLLSDGPLTVTFSGGAQEQSFDGPAYSQGPEAYFFVNGSNFVGSFGVRSLSGTTDIGNILFSTPVDEVNFNAADRANGTPSIRVIGEDGSSILADVTVTSDSNRAAASLFEFSSSVLGERISRIEFDNAGPAGNPPYVTAIDSFSASVTIPEPSSMLLGLIGAVGFFGRRRR